MRVGGGGCGLAFVGNGYYRMKGFENLARNRMRSLISQVGIAKII